MFSTQDSIDYLSKYDVNNNGNNSPVRKKNKSKMFFNHVDKINYDVDNAINDKNITTNDHHFDDTNSGHNNMFGISQDSMPQYSQFSQNFTERMGQLNVYDNNYSQLSIAYNNNTQLSQIETYPYYHHASVDSNQSVAIDNNDNIQQIHISDMNIPLPTKATLSSMNKDNIVIHPSNHSSNLVQTEKEIDIHPVIKNIFLSNTTDTNNAVKSHAESYFQYISRGEELVKKPSKIWIGAYKERPRIITEYEEIKKLGEGTFSTVTCVRHRLDGTLYAVKRLKENISTVKQGHLLVREASALAVLQGCPQIITYYGCWLDNHHMFIKTELCHLGSLEDLISPHPNLTSIMNLSTSILHSHNQAQGYKQSMNAIAIAAVRKNRSDSFNENHNDHINQEAMYSLEYPPQNNQLSVTLEDMQKKYPHIQRGISEDLAWMVLYDISCALAFIHEKDLVHLDLRPANIFLTTSPYYQILDQNDPQLQLIQHLKEEQLQHEEASRKTKQSIFTSILNAKSLIDTTTIHHSENSITNSSVVDSSVADGSLVKTELNVRDKVEKMLLARKYIIKLGDFGHCCRVDEKQAIQEGETRYCARELINMEENMLDVAKADIFSLGATVYELCLGRFLGSEGEEGIQEWHNIRDGRLDAGCKSRYSTNLIQVLQLLMHPNPSERPSSKVLVTGFLLNQYNNITNSNNSNLNDNDILKERIFNNSINRNHQHQQQQQQLNNSIYINPSTNTTSTTTNNNSSIPFEHLTNNFNYNNSNLVAELKKENEILLQKLQKYEQNIS